MSLILFIQRNKLKSVDLKYLAPSEIKCCFPHYNMKIVMGVLNCLRTNAKRFIISSLLCEERASGNESYQIVIKKTNC